MDHLSEPSRSLIRIITLSSDREAHRGIRVRARRLEITKVWVFKARQGTNIASFQMLAHMVAERAPTVGLMEEGVTQTQDR